MRSSILNSAHESVSGRHQERAVSCQAPKARWLIHQHQRQDAAKANAYGPYRNGFGVIALGPLAAVERSSAAGVTSAISSRDVGDVAESLSAILGQAPPKQAAGSTRAWTSGVPTIPVLW